MLKHTENALTAEEQTIMEKVTNELGYSYIQHNLRGYEKKFVLMAPSLLLTSTMPNMAVESVIPLSREKKAEPDFVETYSIECLRQTSYTTQEQIRYPSRVKCPASIIMASDGSKVSLNEDTGYITNATGAIRAVLLDESEMVQIKHIQELANRLRINGNDIPHAKDYLEAIKSADCLGKDPLAEIIMYKLFIDGGLYYGARRALMFALNSGVNPSLIMRYCINISDEGLNHILSYYLNNGGAPGTYCYLHNDGTIIDHTTVEEANKRYGRVLTDSHQ